MGRERALETIYHGVLEFEGAFAGHHVAERGDCADLDGAGDALRWEAC